jgi:hypothetical protein
MQIYGVSQVPLRIGLRPRTPRSPDKQALTEANQLLLRNPYERMVAAEEFLRLLSLLPVAT